MCNTRSAKLKYTLGENTSSKLLFSVCLFFNEKKKKQDNIHTEYPIAMC